MEKNHYPPFLLIDKPKGITSFDVIRILRKKLGIRKMGHGGTLDPLATGLLIVGVKEGTKALKNIIGLPKTYEAEILLGVKTDSGDSDGTVIEEAEVPPFDEAAIGEALQKLIGHHSFPAPIFSALKKNGQPLYRLARAGEYVEPVVKKMEITEASLRRREGNKLTVFFAVSSGTYIRTLAEVLARHLGTIGTITNLRRLSIGDYSIDEARSLSEYDTMAP